jgi:hypothetical protein
VPKVPRTGGTVGLALTAVDVWRRLSPEQRKALGRHARKYGPVIAAQALRSAKAAAASLRERPPS